MNNNFEEDLIEYVVSKEVAGERIDKFLSDMLSSDSEHDNLNLSRSYIQKLIDDQFIFVNQKTIKSNYKIRENDLISISLPEPEDLSIDPEDIPLNIIYEDQDIILINKPKGMVIHPSAGHYHGTLVNALLHHCKGQLSGINGIMRPGIVHRIDKDTTGVIVACKTDLAHVSLSEQFKVHSITRYYEAICLNAFKDSNGIIDAPIGRHPVERKKMAINYKNGKSAVTHYEVIKNFKQYAHIRCQLETGRTHQIRVHMTSLSHPLLGDTVYGPSKQPFQLEGQCLHAGVLGFVHPRTHEYVEFQAPLPDYFSNLLLKLQ